jgi:hypothetical protein
MQPAKENMNPKRIARILVLFLIPLTLTATRLTKAAPVPPKLVVNHDTQECAEIFGGDECMDCFPPQGWEELGWAYDIECPAGYAFTTVESQCTHFKNERCCSEGHSGASGNCEDLVISDRSDQCAFVDDINACNLPRNWKAKPEDVTLNEWTCPNKYDWIADLECLTTDGQDADSGFLPLQCNGSVLGGLLISFSLVVILRRKNQAVP